MVLALPGVASAQAASAQAATAAPASKDEEAIKKVLSDFEAAWNMHDARAFSMTFAEDADFTNVRGRGATGRSAVQLFHTTPFATYFKNSQLKIIDSKVRFLRPDVAAVDAHWEMTGAVDPQGDVIPLRKGLLNFVMTQDSGTWCIKVMHNMDLPTSERMG